jgi:hypothetical protein
MEAQSSPPAKIQTVSVIQCSQKKGFSDPVTGSPDNESQHQNSVRSYVPARVVDGAGTQLRPTRAGCEHGCAKALSIACSSASPVPRVKMCSHGTRCRTDTLFSSWDALAAELGTHAQRWEAWPHPLSAGDSLAKARRTPRRAERDFRWAAFPSTVPSRML